MYPNHEDFYIYSDNNGSFSCTPNHIYYFVRHFSNHTIYDIGLNNEPVENSETNTTVSTNNATIRTHHSSESDKAELDIIGGEIWAVRGDCTVRFELPSSENEIRNIIRVWRRRGKGKKHVNPFMVYRALLSKNLDYKKREFRNGGFQCYISEFASKTWKGKTDSAKKAIENLAAEINKYIEAANIRSTL
ncbi:782_t:CDS:2 [Paraglomus brasilianum]|uniref:782_t:CDS:1 n=1 Tax=Paraglomus brasilianum TaxID=144538 RepID=A0A9N8WQE7_9GLOM|nr:782_t:CDS:2 [Paraglomus brasilianum]